MGETVTPGQLKAMLRDGHELALIDVREQGVFANAHLLFAVCIPLSHMELLIDALVPRRSTRIVLCNDGDPDDALIARATTVLTGIGYSDISSLEGGLEGWRNAGYEVFSGINVPSKAFGEFVEHRCDTPHLSADEVKARIDAGENMIVLDSRPLDEFHRMNIPTGIDTPGAELVYRVFDMAPDPDTLVVVNCAGRTRSIIGAQSLINAGIPNTVVALKDGTMGWHLAGHELEHGQDRRAAAPSPEGLAKAKAAAQGVAARFGVREIDGDTLRQWQREAGERTLYLLDVRTHEEFEQGHLPGSRHAPGGQLVQATDEYAAVRNARLVLIDEDGVRATMTASWLIQLGWRDVFVLQADAAGASLVSGPQADPVPGYAPAETISPGALSATLQSGQSVAVIDLASSLQHRAGHIPGARWAVRSRLADELSKIPATERLIVTSPDGRLAHLAAKDIKDLLPKVEVCVLDGGTEAWKADGLPLERGIERAISQSDDVAFKPYEHREAMEQWMQDYLTWEVGLVEQIERDGDANFRTFT